MQAQPFAIEMAGLTKQFGQHRAVDTLLGGLFPLASLSNAAQFFQAKLTGMVMASNGSIGPVHLPSASMGPLGLIPVAVVVFYLVVPIAVAAIVFRKRDMLGAA